MPPTKIPVTPSLTIALLTPTSSVTTASPLAMDSIRLFGITSVRDGKKNTSPAAYVRESASPPVCPKILTSGKCSICRRNHGRSGPSPATTTRNGGKPSMLPSLLAVSSSVTVLANEPRPFSRTIRATQRITTSPSSVPASAKDCLPIPPPRSLPARRGLPPVDLLPTPMTSRLNSSERCAGEYIVRLIPRGKKPMRSLGTPISERCSAAA